MYTSLRGRTYLNCSTCKDSVYMGLYAADEYEKLPLRFEDTSGTGSSWIVLISRRYNGKEPLGYFYGPDLAALLNYVTLWVEF